MSVHVTRLLVNGNAFFPNESPERLTVPCRWCKHGYIIHDGGNNWSECPACLGTLTRSETDAEMAARLAGDLDEWERLQRPEE